MGSLFPAGQQPPPDGASDLTIVRSAGPEPTSPDFAGPDFAGQTSPGRFAVTMIWPRPTGSAACARAASCY